MKRVMVFMSMLVFIIFMALPASGGLVEWNGALIDSNQIPQETTPVNMQVLDVNNSAPPELPYTPYAYGTTAWTTLSLGACDAFHRGVYPNYHAPNCNYIQPEGLSSNTDLGWPIHLPNGALIQYVDLQYYDNDTSYNPSAGLYHGEDYGSMTSIINLSPTAYSGGNRTVRFGPFTHTVQNWSGGSGRFYYILAVLNNGATTYNRIYGFTIWYTLQISPAPATATFSDVPTGHPFFQHIQALYASGITAGCGASIYCPDSFVTRGQMAAFLARALGLHWPR